MAQTKAQLIDGKGAVDLGALSISGSAPDNSVNLDASGRFLVGTSTAPSVGDSQYSLISILGSTAGSTTDSYFSLRRGQAPASIASGSGLGTIVFGANDGSPYAAIIGQTDGTGGSGDYPGRLVFSTTADGASSPTERMRIKSNGEVIFDGTSASSSWASPGTIHIAQRSGSSALTSEGYGDGIGFAFAVKQSGSASGGNGWAFICYNSSNSSIGGIRTSTTATSFPTSSDYRLKENIVPITDALERVQALKPRRFNFIVEPGKIVDGFLAHEVQDIVPEAIHGIKDEVDDEGNPVYQGIDQSKLVPLLTAALQEAVAKIESLEARLTAAGI